MADVSNATPITASGVIGPAGKRIFKGCSLSPAAAASTLIVYDGADATGPVIAKLVCPASVSTVVLDGVAVPCTTGIYAAVTGASVQAVVYWE